MITEAHPKVCYYASTGNKADWEIRESEMISWLIGELNLDLSPSVFDANGDHCFDAGMAALAALRGLNGDWSRDLHKLTDETNGAAIRFYGMTHYWWPSDPSQSPAEGF